MTAAPVILFVPNAGPGVGGGHVLRCLSLARVLRERGARCVFATPEPGGRLVERFGDGVFEAHAAETPAEAAALSPALQADAVVLDHYALDALGERAFGGADAVVMALDDLADRPHACDLLLDPGYGRRAGDYAGKVPESARLLLGPDYALLRPGFAARREAAFAPVRQRVERVFISFGLSDVAAIAARAVSLIRRALPHAHLDVALASDAESLPGLERLAAVDPTLALHVDALEVAALIAAADVAVGAGGSATWERFCLGAPSLAVVVAANQRPLIRALHREAYLIGCELAGPEFEKRFLTAFARLDSPERRAQLRERSRGLCDGKGAERAAAALMSAIDQKR